MNSMRGAVLGGVAFGLALLYFLMYEPYYDGEWGVCTDGEVYTICTSSRVNAANLFPLEFQARWWASRRNRVEAELDAKRDRVWGKKK